MILRIRVEVKDNATEPPLTEREIQIEAAPDELHDPCDTAYDYGYDGEG